MIIQRVRLKNWKNFKSVDVNLSTRVFIVGANASGKSNFLDVFRFMRDIVKQAGGLQYAVEERGGVPKIRCLAARNEADISIDISIGESNGTSEEAWRYFLAFKHTGGGIQKNQAIVLTEKVWKDGVVIFDRSTKSDDSETRKFTYLEQVHSNADFRDIYKFFQDVQYLHVVPQLVRDSDTYFLASGKEDFFGRNLLDRMSVLNASTRNAYLKRINEVLQIAVPQLSELSFVDKKDDPKGTPHLEARYIHWRPKGAKHSEHQFSDGTLRLIGFMWALLDGSETILLEEPELYLHAEIVKQLPEFIHKMQRRKGRVRQVILTTHSYDLLNTHTISADEILVLKPTQEGTEIHKASDIEEVRNYLEAGFSPAEAVNPITAPTEIKRINQLTLFES